MKTQMNKNNKETELILQVGKIIIKYLDYVLIFFCLPLMFVDIKWTDYRMFIILGVLITTRAIIPLIQLFVGKGLPLIVLSQKGSGETIPLKNHIATSGEGKINYPDQKDISKTVPETEETKVTETTEDIIFSHVVIDNRQLQTEKLHFPALSKITTKKTEDNEVIVQMPDFRTIRLKKEEVPHFYKALLESDIRFFYPGSWEATIQVKECVIENGQIKINIK